MLGASVRVTQGGKVHAGVFFPFFLHLPSFLPSTVLTFDENFIEKGLEGYFVTPPRRLESNFCTLTRSLLSAAYTSHCAKKHPTSQKSNSRPSCQKVFDIFLLNHQGDRALSGNETF